MNKGIKIVVMIILFMIISFSVYFIINKPMLSIENNNLLKHKSHDVIDQYDYKDQEDKPSSVKDDILYSIKTTIGYLFSKETNIVAIGDSLTEGVGDETDRSGYVGILDETINEKHHIAHFENYGKRGERTDQLLNRLEQTTIKTSIKKADIILITIGANDIMKIVKENFANLSYDHFSSEQAYFKKRLRSIYSKIKEYNSHAHIFLLGLYNPFQQYFGDIEELDLIVDEWNLSSNEVTAEFANATFIPVKDIFVTEKEDLFAEDHFHPNDYGYFRIAERVLHYLTNER